MLNEIIKIDLHIHSKASEYKDGNIVKESNINNIDRLLLHLEENEISLFSITDHNRFDYDLYKAFKEKIESESYKYVKNILPGIEFDVAIEANKPKCHIIVIFDDSDKDNVKRIEERLFSIKKLEKNEEIYTLDEFEKILKAIGLKSILIVHQRQSLDNSKPGNDSLSSSVDDPFVMLKCGYIDVLEYNRPRVEGIVKASLQDVDYDFPLITGSDCHNWRNYPNHDAFLTNNKHFTELKCLPTFKGLLLSITSFKSRVNRKNNENSNYIKGFSIKNHYYDLCNGINAIIGDNGSGKSLLLNMLKGKSVTYYDKLIKKNEIKRYKTEDLQETMISFIEQDSIAERVREGQLFEGTMDYYEEIQGKDDFAISINEYFNKLLEYINHNIDVDEGRKKLANKEYSYKEKAYSFYYPNIDDNISNEDETVDSLHISVLENIYEKYKKEIIDNVSYYTNNGLINEIIENLEQMARIINHLKSILFLKNARNRVKGIVAKHFGDYNSKLQTEKSSAELSDSRLLAEIAAFKKAIVDQARLECKRKAWPEFPEKRKGISIKQVKGYEFKKVAKYNDVYLEEDFYDTCFNKGYKSVDALKKIRQKDELSDALKGGNYQEIQKYREQKIDSFIKKWQAETTYISEVSSAESIGNTPGEVSLIFYKFIVREENNNYDVLLIDQPEDDINPGKINEYLLSYLQSIRDTKQIILVTHNPMLVVNLDVDNLICINKNKEDLNVFCGCLESEDNGNMLNLAMDNLDGGYEAVQRRLRVYGR